MVLSRNRAQLVSICLVSRVTAARESPEYSSPRPKEKVIGLVPVGVLHDFRCLIRARHSVEMVGDHGNGNSRLVVLVVQECFDEFSLR